MAIVETKTGYKVRYRIGTKQYSKSGFSTKKEAKAYEAEQLRRKRSGSWTDPKAGSVTIQTVFDDWLASKQISNRTRSDYAEVWNSCIRSEWADVRLSDVSPASVQRWISRMDDRYSQARTSKAVTILSQVFDWAVADERILDNPAKRARALTKGRSIKLGGSKRQKRFLDQAEVAHLAVCAGDDGDMLLVMSYTGLRFGEVTASRAPDVDLLRGRLAVRRAHSDVRGRLEVVPPKSGRERMVPIPKLLRPVLERRLASITSPDGLLFRAPMGGPVRYSRWRRDVFNKAVVKAGLSGVTPHSLRHTYAALAVRAGTNPKVLQVAMGHSDIRLTLDTYGGLYGDDLDRLAEGLDDIATGKPSMDVPISFPRASGRQKGRES